MLTLKSTFKISFSETKGNTLASNIFNILSFGILAKILLLTNTQSTLPWLESMISKPFGIKRSKDLEIPALPCGEFFPSTKISSNGGNLISSKLKVTEYFMLFFIIGMFSEIRRYKCKDFYFNYYKIDKFNVSKLVYIYDSATLYVKKQINVTLVTI